MKIVDENENEKENTARWELDKGVGDNVWLFIVDWSALWYIWYIHNICRVHFQCVVMSTQYIYQYHNLV